jgi:ribulose-phosphate 3-epimerase
MGVMISASVLSADFANLGQEIAAAERGGADLIHVDVMDGHFVPNLSMGIPVVQAIRRVASTPLDVHLMLQDPDRYLEAFAEAGASRITVHAEVLPHLHRTLQVIRRLGLLAGVALNPSTPAGVLEDVAGDLDLVLVMSVNPGFSGQTFIPRTESKIRAVRSLLDGAGSGAPISVDGGVDRGNAGRLVAAGAEILVAGSAIFAGGAAEAATRDLRAAALQNASC